MISASHPKVAGALSDAKPSRRSGTLVGTQAATTSNEPRELANEGNDMSATKNWMYWMVAGLSLGMMGCAVDTEDEDDWDGEVEVEELGQSQDGFADPAFIKCSVGLHPSTSAGNLIVERDPSDNIVSTQPTECAVMGLIHVDPVSNHAWEVVADASLVTFGGGSSAPMTCGLCQQHSGGGGNPPPPGQTVGAWGRFTMPSSVTSIGVLGDYPYGSMPYYGASWHWSGYSPSGSSKSSFCDNGPSVGSSAYGPLTNPLRLRAEALRLERDLGQPCLPAVRRDLRLDSGREHLHPHQRVLREALARAAQRHLQVIGV